MAERECQKCEYWLRLAPTELSIYINPEGTGGDEGDVLLFSNEVDDLAVVGRCLRYPPIFNPVAFAEFREREGKYDQKMTSLYNSFDHPIVDELHWCGEFKPKIT